MLFDEYPLDEGGVKIAHVAHLASGFYAWELAFLLSLAYCLTMTVGTRKAA